MTKTEICRKITGLNGGQRTLVYFITDDKGKTARYGVAIRLEESGEQKEVRHLSNDIERIEKLVDILATDFVSPNRLDDVVYKLLAVV